MKFNPLWRCDWCGGPTTDKEKLFPMGPDLCAHVNSCFEILMWTTKTGYM